MILAIDPGSNRAGWALFHDGGALNSSGVVISNGSTTELVAAITPVVMESELIAANGYDGINKVIIERQFVGPKSNSKSILMCNFAGGVFAGAVLACLNTLVTRSCMGVEMIFVMPRSWQAVAVGASGRKCSKAMVREAASDLYGINAINDEADAVCMGHWYLHDGRFKH